MKTAKEYHSGIYEMNTEQLVERMATMFADISDQLNSISESGGVARLIGAMRGAIDLASVYFSTIYLEKPIVVPPMPTTTGTYHAPFAVAETIKNIASCMNAALCIASTTLMVDFDQMHGNGKNPTEREIQRSKELCDRMPSIISFILVIERVASDWLMQNDLED